jgi:hypothetical protein
MPALVREPVGPARFKAWMAAALASEASGQRG